MADPRGREACARVCGRRGEAAPWRRSGSLRCGVIRRSACSMRPSRRWSVGGPYRCGPAARFPVVPELQRGGAPVLLTGIGLPDDGLHSPNEKVDAAADLGWDRSVFGNFFQMYFAEKEPAEAAEIALGAFLRSSLFALRGLTASVPARISGFGARVQLIHADERAHRGDDSRHHVIGPVGIGALIRAAGRTPGFRENESPSRSIGPARRRRWPRSRWPEARYPRDPAAGVRCPR